MVDAQISPGLRVLVTGGAGFIGSRLVRRLRAAGADVLVFDNLHPQVHGDAAAPPDLAGAAFVRGDVTDEAALAQAVSAHKPQLTYHLAAETGTGQSYDLLAHYCAVNIQGTAYLVEALRKAAAGGRVVLAGSRAIYGEGGHRDAGGALVTPDPRDPDAMRAGQFDCVGADGTPLTAVPTPENATPRPASIYASTKLMQEHVLTQGLADTNIQPVLLRFQNVYGPGQSLKNPYTGVLSIFSGQILDGAVLNIFEDGAITRDFVFVDDIVEACFAAGSAAAPGMAPINIGSGEAATIVDVARMLLKALGAPEDRLKITGDFRVGDVRHAVADIARARNALGWTPKVLLEDGLAALAAWVKAERGA